MRHDHQLHTDMPENTKQARLVLGKLKWISSMGKLSKQFLVCGLDLVFNPKPKHNKNEISTRRTDILLKGHSPEMGSRVYLLLTNPLHIFFGPSLGYIFVS